MSDRPLDSAYPFLPVPLARGQVCPLCREAIGEGDETVLVPDFLADEGDPLWPYSNALYHRACFLLWDRRKELIARFNALARARSRDPAWSWRLTADGTLQRVAQEDPTLRAPLLH
jgi:hypothetical protein